MGQGIGTKLMVRIEAEGKDARRFELFTGHRTAGALHIYQKMGYQEFKRTEMDTHILVFLEKWVKGASSG
jgi:ribosomal protein S18 acetylase RimI-like enzyme